MEIKVRYNSYCLFFLLTGIILFSNQLFAQASKTYKAIELPPPWNLPVIDGDLSDEIWSYAVKDSLLFGGMPDSFGVRWTDYGDNLVTWRAVWSSSSNKLYVAIQITDDIQGNFDHSNPGETNFLPFQDDCLELFVDGDNSGGFFDGTYDQAQQWLVTGQNKIILDSYPQAIGYNLYAGYDLITAVTQETTTGNWICEAEFRIYDTMHFLRKTLTKGDTIGWNIWYDDSDNETFIAIDSTYDRDHQVGWLYSGKAYNDADYFGDIILGDIPRLPPVSPVLVEPTENVFTNNARPQLTWNVPADLNGDSLHFKVEIAYDSSFSNQISDSPFESQINASGFNPMPPLLESTGTCNFTPQNDLPDGVYWWRVTARDSLAYGISSSSRKFTIDTVQPVIHQITLQNPDFGTNWYNPQKNQEITVEVEYSELNAHSCSLSIEWLPFLIPKDNIVEGVNQKVLFNIVISHILDDNYRLGATISDKAGNSNSDSTTINIDSTPPRGTKANSPAISYDTSFVVHWSGGVDGNGSGLSGKYDINMKIDNGAWMSWQTNYEGDSCQFNNAENRHRYAFEVMAWDNVGNREDSTGIAESVTIVKIIPIDTTAPPPPITLKANGSNPSPWQQSSEFSITWQNPIDSSGIALGLFKLGVEPTNNLDITGTTSASPPFFNITATQEFSQSLYLWLEDSSGNANYLNRDSVILRYDVTPPTGTVTASPDTSTNSNFVVSWQGGNDGIGSGLSGFYDVQYKKDDSIWVNWRTKFFGTSDNFPGKNGHRYSFEALAWDVVGNREDSTGNAESTTFVYVDTEAPPAPINPLANGSNPSPRQQNNKFVINWENPYDPSGIVRCLFKLGSAPLKEDDTTGTASPFPPLIIEATEESNQPLYLWLEDGAGNVDYNRHSFVILRYDATLPIVEITSPGNNDKIRNSIEIWASISDSNLYDFKLEHRTQVAAPWKYLHQDTISHAIKNQLIYIWKNSTDSGMVYLKLTVGDSFGNSQSDYVQFILDNRLHEVLVAQIIHPPNKSYLSSTINMVGSAYADNFEKYLLLLKNEAMDTVLVEGVSKKQNEILHILDTRSFPDGEYTLLLTVVTNTASQKSDSITINIINTEFQPIAVIINPSDNSFVHDTVKVIGIAAGVNFKKYSLSLIGNITNKVLGDSTNRVNNNTLISFDTKKFLDGKYTLSLTVFNSDDTKYIDNVSICIDNTLPQAKIFEPTTDTISCFVDIKGEASDRNLDGVSLKYAEILEIDPFKFHPIAEICSTCWDTRNLNGYYTLKLTATDKGGLQTEDERVYYIDNPVFDQRSGLNKNHEQFNLYIPPNGYEPAVICIEQKEIEEFGYNPATVKPTELICQIHSTIAKEYFYKPANFKIDYGNINQYDENKLAIFQWKNKAWQFLGGTIDREKKVISTTIDQIGVYGLFESYGIEDAIVKDFKLVCQPRVFSPRGGGYSTETNLSFTLKKDSHVTIKIFNLAGRLVKLVCENKPMTTGTNSIPWNGLDNEDRYCVSGLYVVLLQTDEREATQTVMVLNK